jgi:cytochrome c oxidase assembly protein subunit 15
MAHRAGAIVTFLYLGWVALRGLKQDSSLRNTAASIIVFLVIQAGLGISAVLSDLPLWLVTAHNATAAMLLLAVVNLNHRVTPT